MSRTRDDIAINNFMSRLHYNLYIQFIYIMIYICYSKKYICIYIYIHRYLQSLKIPLCNDSRLVLYENDFPMGIGIKKRLVSKEFDKHLKNLTNTLKDSKPSI